MFIDITITSNNKMGTTIMLNHKHGYRYSHHHHHHHHDHDDYHHHRHHHRRRRHHHPHKHHQPHYHYHHHHHNDRHHQHQHHISIIITTLVSFNHFCHHLTIAAFVVSSVAVLPMDLFLGDLAGFPPTLTFERIALHLCVQGLGFRV